MKKSQKTTTGILLMGILVLSMAGCGSDAKSLIGTWTCETSAKDLLYDSDSMSTDEDLLNVKALDSIFFDIVGQDGLTVTYTFTFNEDGTCSLVANQDEVLENFEKLCEDNKDELTERIIVADNITFSESYDYVDDNAFIDEEDMFGQYVANWKAELEGQMEFLEKNDSPGYNYVVKGNSLYITYADSEIVTDTDCYGNFKLSGDTLEIQAEGNEFLMIPETDWTYTRQ